MEILGIGMSELIFIVIIALIVLGPKDMQKAGKTIGKWLNEFIHSDLWKVVEKTSTELRNLPRNLMRDVNVKTGLTDEDIRNPIKLNPYSSVQKKMSNSKTIHRSSAPVEFVENKISPLETKENESDSQEDA